MARRSGEFHDWGKTYKGFSKAITGAGKTINQIAMFELQRIAGEFLAEQDAQWPRSTVKDNGAKFGGDHNHPWYSGQLHDSVAVRIAQGNKTVSVQYMPPAADPNRPQYTETEKGIIGSEWAHMVAETKAPYYFLPGVQVQLLVGVPYAEKVNAGEEGKYGQPTGRHLGFFDTLADELTNKVDDWIFGGGLKRLKVYVDENGNAKVRGLSNIKRG